MIRPQMRLPGPVRKAVRAPKVLRDLLTHPINRGQKLPALTRFARWQVGARFSHADMVHPWIGGTRFLVRRGETGLTGNVYAGLHEFEEMAFLLHLLRPEDCFVDVGANSGSYTLLAAGVVGARAIAFEPVPQSRERLEANLRLNGLDHRVDVISKGVGEAPDVVSFTLANGCKNHVATQEEVSEEPTFTVEVTTLDEALSEHEPTLIKIDVEGYELPVLRGAESTLSSPSLLALIVEVNRNLSRYGFASEDLDRLLERFGFGRYAYEPFARTLSPLAPGEQQERPWSDNVLFLRDAQAVQQRIETAPTIEVLGVRL